MLLAESLQFFREVAIEDFLGGRDWAPRLEKFGVLPLIYGTMLVAVGSTLIAVPVGMGAAIYLSEYASPATRNVIKPALEMLAGIPSVVYGYVAVVIISPWLCWFFDRPNSPFNALSACVVVAVMILPIIISLSEDVLRAVPVSLRQAAYGLGATRYDVTTGVVVPAAMSGIIASILLAIGRAVGETMAVTLAAGLTPVMPTSLFTVDLMASIQTMTAYMVQVTQGDTPVGSVAYRTIFAVGLTLFTITMLMNLAARWILASTREKYE